MVVLDRDRMAQSQRPPAEKQFSGPARRGLAWSAALILLLGAGYLVQAEFHRHGFEWERVRAALTGLEAEWLVWAACIALVSYVGRAIRWAVLLRPVRRDPDMGALISSTLIGFAAITALGRPGELVRPYLIANSQQVSFSSQLAAWIVERMYDLLIALVLFGFALNRAGEAARSAHPSPALQWVLQTGGWVALGLGGVCLTLLLLMRVLSAASVERISGTLERISTRLPGAPGRSIEKLVTTFFEGAASTRSLPATLQVLFWTVLEWVLIGLCYGSVLRAFGGLQLSAWDVVTVMGLVSVGSLLQIPGIGGGMQVATVLVLTELYDIPLEIATSVAVVLWAMTFALVLPVGTVLAVRQGISWASVRAARKEAAS